MEYKVGDRYQDNEHKDVWEYLGNDEWILLDNGLTLPATYKGAKERQTVCEDNVMFWTYLGNFNKSDKFNELYNILNS